MSLIIRVVADGEKTEFKKVPISCISSLIECSFVFRWAKTSKYGVLNELLIFLLGKNVYSAGKFFQAFCQKINMKTDT